MKIADVDIFDRNTQGCPVRDVAQQAARSRLRHPSTFPVGGGDMPYISAHEAALTTQWRLWEN
jgi:hypothetical protein